MKLFPPLLPNVQTSRYACTVFFVNYKIDGESVDAHQCPVSKLKFRAACSTAMSKVFPPTLFRSSFVCHYKLCSLFSNGSSRLEISTIYPTLWRGLVLKVHWLHQASFLISPHDRASQGHKGI